MKNVLWKNVWRFNKTGNSSLIGVPSLFHPVITFTSYPLISFPSVILSLSTSGILQYEIAVLFIIPTLSAGCILLSLLSPSIIFILFRYTLLLLRLRFKIPRPIMVYDWLCTIFKKSTLQLKTKIHRCIRDISRTTCLIHLSSILHLLTHRLQWKQ